jgi:transcriptional regulator with XRE-family HTH domain
VSGNQDGGRDAGRTRGGRERARLVAELRDLRERSGLTLAELAEKSAYSRSSWQRYLSGAALPPWLAVRALCLLAGEPEPRIRALWELAEGAGSGREAVAPASGLAAPEPAAPGPAPDAPDEAAAPAEPSGRPRRFPRGFRAGAVASALLLTAVAGAALHRDAHAGGRTPAHGASGPASGFHVACTGAACDGRNPEKTLCGVEPQTLLQSLPAKGPGLEVRYQPLCRAVWARTWNNRRGDRLTLSEPGAPTQSVTVTDSHTLDGFTYTPLLALTGGHPSLKVCLTTSARPSAVCYPVPLPPGARSKG